MQDQPLWLLACLCVLTGGRASGVSFLETEWVGGAPPKAFNPTCFTHHFLLPVLSVGQGSGLTPSHPRHARLSGLSPL